MAIDWIFIVKALQLIGVGTIISLIVLWYTKARRLKFVVTLVPSEDGPKEKLRGERGFDVVAELKTLEEDDFIRKMVQPRFTYVVAKIISLNSAVFAVEAAELCVLDHETGVILWYPPHEVIVGGVRVKATPQNLRKLLSDTDRHVTYVFQIFGRPRVLYLEVVDDRHDRRGMALHRRWKSVRKRACNSATNRELASHMHAAFELPGRLDECFERKRQVWAKRTPEERARVLDRE